MNELLPVSTDVLAQNFVALLAGVIVNWLIVCRNEKVNIIEYWTEERYGTYTTILGSLIAFISTIFIEPELGTATYFAIGVACDSVLNKLPLPTKVKEELTKAEAKIHEQEEILNLVASGDTAVVDRLCAEGCSHTDRRAAHA